MTATIARPEVERGGATARLAPRRRRFCTPAQAVVVLVLTFSVTFAVLAVRQHDAYGTWGFDLGIYDQTFWLVSRGRSFMTMRGMNLWGHHLNLIAILFAPAYWLGAGPRFLVSVQAVVLALGAVPVFLLVRKRLASPWAGVVGAAGYLLYSPVEWLSWTNFHPEALSVTPLLFAWWFSTERRWRAAWLVLLLALTMREEVGLVVAMFGIVLVLWARHADASHRRTMRVHGIAMAGVGACWFFVASQLVIPAFTGGAEPFYISRYYAGWGSSMGEVLLNVIRRPTRVLHQIIARRAFLLQLLAPTALLGAFAPSLLLLALPQALVVLLGNRWFLFDIRFQYTALLLPGVVLATVECAARLWHRPAARRSVVLAIVGAAVFGHLLLAPSPLAKQSWQWADYGHRVDVDAAVAMVPKGVAVAASEHIVPHLTGRAQVWDLPNPYLALFYGPSGVDQAKFVDANAPEWLLVETASTGGETETKLIAELRRLGTHRVVYEREGITVLRKQRNLSTSELRIIRATLLVPEDAATS